jgi:hypothetical protein
MNKLRTFVNDIEKETHNKKNFLQFLVTSNKAILSELILSELINKSLEEKDKNQIRFNILDLIKTNSENKIYFGLNKKKTNKKYLFYDLFISSDKKNKDLFEFENVTQKIKESLSLKTIKDFICLQVDSDTKQQIIHENEVIKIPNTNFTISLIDKFGFDWFLKDNFIKKINFFSNSSSYYYSLNYLNKLNTGYKLLLSKYFVSFTASRSDDSTNLLNNQIKFYGSSEAFINFFDENSNCYHLAKINIGEPKFNEALQKLDTLCLEKELNLDNKFTNLNFAIQSGMVLL